MTPLVFAAVLGGCDSLLGPEAQTRIYLSQATRGGASFSVSPADGEVNADRNGPGAVLALVDALDVTITAVQAQQAQFVDSPAEDAGWETLTFQDPVTVNLLGLPADSSGLEIVSGDLPPGAYVRLRFLVSEAELTLQAPLTLGRYTFPANEPIPVAIPNPWVKVPGAYFTVTDDAGAAVRVQFDPASSLGQLTVTSDGTLRLTPVMRGSNWADDHDWKDRDHDEDDEDDRDR